MSVTCIIVAAGKGKRFGGDKMFSNLGEKIVLEHAIFRFQNHEMIDSIIVVVSELAIDSVQKICTRYDKVKHVILGGEHRAQSVKNGFDKCGSTSRQSSGSVTGLSSLDDGDLVLIHNGSNPLVTEEEITSVIEALSEYQVASVGHLVTDTVKRVDENGVVLETIDRSELRLMQTPQGFHREVLKKFYEEIGVIEITDELQLAEQMKERVKIVPASYQNFKITTQEDLKRATGILMGSEVLVGIGEDSHRFSEGGELILGGLTIPDYPKLDGNSDADVIYHAIFNAISSTLGQGSISTVADEMCQQGIKDSAEYLKVLLQDLRNRKLSINNISISLEGARPKIEPIADQMKTNISELLSVPKERIGVTATSGEKLTSFGKGEGVQCRCIVTLYYF